VTNHSTAPSSQDEDAGRRVGLQDCIVWDMAYAAALQCRHQYGAYSFALSEATPPGQQRRWAFCPFCGGGIHYRRITPNRYWRQRVIWEVAAKALRMELFGEKGGIKFHAASDVPMSHWQAFSNLAEPRVSEEAVSRGV